MKELVLFETDYGNIDLANIQSVKQNKTSLQFEDGKNIIFDLQIPTKEIFKAKLCQENSKALMTNPNKALSDWLLRKVLQLEHEEIATIEKLDTLGIDSVIITKDTNGLYKIDVMKTNSYSEFINDTPF